jgi:hypothetical protein
VRPYLIGTGYFSRGKVLDAESFYRIWWKNKMRYSHPKRIIVIAHGGCHASPRTMRENPADWIFIDGDIGHVHQLVNGEKPFHYSGFTMALLTLAMLAYQDECDLFFCEQDMLAFGPWPATIYSDCGDAKVCYGTGKMMTCFQSLMLIKHEYLPQFIHNYLGEGIERSKENEGEVKHKRLAERYPNDYRPFSFGFDRDRPLDLSQPVFYAQQLNGEELTSLKNAGLLEL